MNVGELRKRLTAFDDSVEVVAAPRIRMQLVNEGERQIEVPHPTIQQEIANLHVAGKVDAETQQVTERYLVLAYEPKAALAAVDAPAKGITCTKAGSPCVCFLE